MPPEEVIERDAPEQPVVPEKGQGDKGKEETVTISRAELESIRRESQERAESAQYWSTLHRKTAAPEPEAEEEDGSEFLDEETASGLEGDTPEKLVDDLASKGDSALKSRGYVKASEVKQIAADIAVKVSRELIGRERQKITSDATIMSEFPELKDQNSELFKETAKIYQAAVAMDPSAKKTPAALFLAAKAAKASLRTPTRSRHGANDDYERNADDDYDRPEPEEDRRRRTDSQDGRTRGRGEVDHGDDMIGDEARAVIKAMGITEEEYAASKKALGVNGGRARRR